MVSDVRMGLFVFAQNALYDHRLDASDLRQG